MAKKSKGKRRSPAQIVNLLRKVELAHGQGSTMAEAIAARELSEQIYYRWRKKYGAMGGAEVRRLKELEQENARLKKLVADLSLDEGPPAGGVAGKNLSPAAQRTAVEHVQQVLGISQRQVCRALGFARSTIRYQPVVRGDEATIVEAMARYRAKHPTWGCAKIARLVRNEGPVLNHKRAERIWREHGWQCVPPARKSNRGRGEDGNACRIRRAEHGNQVWAIDYTEDATSDGQKLKILTVLDEYTREALAGGGQAAHGPPGGAQGLEAAVPRAWHPRLHPV